MNLAPRGTAWRTCDFIAKIIENTVTKTTSGITSKILNVTADMASYTAQGGAVLFFEGNTHDPSLTESLGGWTVTDLSATASEGATAAQIAEIQANTQKISYTDAAVVAQRTTFRRQKRVNEEGEAPSRRPPAPLAPHAVVSDGRSAVWCLSRRIPKSVFLLEPFGIAPLGLSWGGLAAAARLA